MTLFPLSTFYSVVSGADEGAQIPVTLCEISITVAAAMPLLAFSPEWEKEGYSRRGPEALANAWKLAWLRGGCLLGYRAGSRRVLNIQRDLYRKAWIFSEFFSGL